MNDDDGLANTIHQPISILYITLFITCYTYHTPYAGYVKVAYASVILYRLNDGV